MPAAPTAPPEAPPAPTNPESKQTIIVAPPTEAPPPPKPGSARARMFADLEKRGKPQTGQAPATEEPPTKPPVTEKPAEQKPAASPTEKPAETTAPPTGEKPPVTQTEPAKKTSPWKLVDDYKAKVIALEKQLAERTAVPQEELKTIQERAQKYEARNKELEDEIRFVNYRKSQEFREKYDEPYQRAWKSAMSDLGELTVNTGNGQRPVTEQDILELVSLPLAKAREIADEVFGNFADDVMAHRKTIRQLWDTQAAALDDVRKNGETREKERMDKLRANHQQLSEFITNEWKAVNESVTKDEVYGQYFTPKEGDEEGNNRLKKGFELVDQAWKENPGAPNLTPEERKQIIKRHAAVRNRAAAFGRLVTENRSLQKRVAELEAKDKARSASVPSTGGERSTSSPATGGSVREQMLEELRKRAK